MLTVFKAMLICVALIFMLAGCVFGMEEELPERSVRLLFGVDATGDPHTLIEFVEPNDFRVVSFGIYSPMLPYHLRHIHHREQIIDADISLDDFMSKAPNIRNIIMRLDEREIFELEAMELTPEQMNDIMILVDNVAANPADKEFETVSAMSGHIPYVWAIIDGNMYWSFYTPTPYRDDVFAQHWRAYVNDDLLALAFKLIDLSPVPVGGSTGARLSFRTPGN